MRLSIIKKILAPIAQVETCCEEDIDIRYLLTDSRELKVESRESKVESQTLFFAIKTAKNDGAKYIPELKQKGVKAFVSTNGLEALQTLAAYVRSQFDGPVIGITGSNGKTVVKEWLYELLKDDYEVIRSPKSYNSQIGVPLSVWGLEAVTGERLAVSGKRPIAIFEAGISQPGEMEKLEAMIRPSLGVITYIGPEHGENFASLEAKRAEKMKLFAHCPQVIEDPTHQNARTCAAVLRALGYSEDKITERIMHQTHETVLQVNLTALVQNVRFLRSLMPAETKLTCMVKAFAYGTGSIEVSKALQQSGAVDYLAVAVADEGVELRRAGITLPIIVMDPEEAAMDILLENNLEPNVYSFASLETVYRAAAAKGLEDYPIHLKIDSGMHRLGFYREEVGLLVNSLKAKGDSRRVLKVKSVFSHFAGSDEAQFDAFTRQQAEYFQDCAKALQEGLGYSVIRHICNSAGIERFPQYHFEMCRLGIGLYGISFAGNPLQSVCTLKTTILSVKTVKAGETIGYGRHTTLQEDRQIAVIPIGYADGFDRRFSNYGGRVYVRGQLCPIVGNVCMDQAMVDVTGTDARVGDYVEVFGEHISLEQLSEQLQTIPYEILTSVSRRVTRQYLYQ